MLSVIGMTPETTPSRLTHDELAPFTTMREDARATDANLHLDEVRSRIHRPAPSLAYEDFPTEIPKRGIEVTEAAQRIANALHLHLD